jgi:hypothetical protein
VNLFKKLQQPYTKFGSYLREKREAWLSACASDE